MAIFLVIVRSSRFGLPYLSRRLAALPGHFARPVPFAEKAAFSAKNGENHNKDAVSAR
jgi:hypothetical protein